MFGNPKPIPIEAYKCPVCDEIMYCSLEEATRHAKHPVDESPLPEGLLMVDGDKVCVVLGRGDFFSEDDEGPPHTLYQAMVRFSKTLKAYDSLMTGLDTRELKKQLKEGKYRLLSEEEFSQSRELVMGDEHGLARHGINEPIRTTPEVEALLSGNREAD
jgi:hypothetical protein